jgi:uncharacterized Zn finger protein (UPF0148 family)
MRERNCPLTGGRPLSITRNGWETACAKTSADADEKMKNGLLSRRSTNFAAMRIVIMPACIECSGEVPGEVEFIELSRLNIKQEDTMTTRTPGTCDHCGEKKNVKKNSGMLVCPYCEILLINARNRPQVVAAALRKYAPELFTSTELSTELPVETKQNALRMAELEQEIKELVEDNLLLRESHKELKQIVDAAKEAEKNGRNQQNRAMQDLALRLAMAMLRGKIEGITYNDIETLRGC